MNTSLAKVGAAVVAALALGVQTATAQVTKSGQGYLFRAKFVKGKTILYSVKGILPAQPGQQTSVAMPVVQSVTAVRGNAADLSISVGPMMMNGQPMGQRQSAKVTVDSRMKLLSGDKAAAGAASFTTLPASPVKIGGTWTSKQALGMVGGSPGGNVTVTYKLVGMKNLGGKQVAALLLTLSNTGAGSMSGQGTAHINAADGLLQDMVLHLKTRPMTTGGKGASAPLNITLKVDRS